MASPSSLNFQRTSLALISCAVMFLFALNFGAFSVLLPHIGASFGIGLSAEGKLFPANFAGFTLGVLLCGYLSDRLGRKAALLIGVSCYTVGLILFARASAFPVALVASALIGGGSGAMETAASALVYDLIPERRAFILNAIQIAFGAGASIGPALAHQLISAGIGWPYFYLGVAAANFGLLLLLAFQPIPRGDKSEQSIDIGALRAVFKQPVFLLLCLAEMLYVGAEAGFFSWMPSYFRQRLPGGVAWEGIVVTLFWVAMTIGRTAMGGIIGRIPLLRLIFLLAAGGAASSALALVWTHPLPVLAFVALTGLCFAGIFSLILSEAGERYPRFAGTVFGCVVAAGGLGGAIFPWLIGALADSHWGWRGGLLLVPILSGGLAILSIGLYKSHSSQE